MTDESTNPQPDEEAVHESLDTPDDNVLPLDVNDVPDPADVPDQPVPVHSSDDPVPTDDVAVDDPQPVVDSEPAVDNVPDEVPVPTVTVEPVEYEVVEEELIIPHEVFVRMAAMLRKRRFNQITQAEAEQILNADDKLRDAIYSSRNWH